MGARVAPFLVAVQRHMLRHDLDEFALTYELLSGCEVLINTVENCTDDN